MRKPCGTFDENYGQSMAVLRTRFQWVMLILFLVLLFMLPQFTSPFVLSLVSSIGFVTIGALGLNILTGYCGQISLGHAAFIAVGGEIAAILMFRLGWSWWATLPFAIIGTMLIGAIFGLPSLRLKGFYLAMSTLAAHFIIYWVLLNWVAVTGGIDGFHVAAPKLGGVVFDTEKEFFYLIMAFTVVMVFLAKNLIRGRLGRAFIAIRDNDIAAQFMGIDIFRYKVIAFMVAAAFAAVAGSLRVAYWGYATCEQLVFMDNIWYIGYIIIGGLGSITGTIFGVAFLELLRYGVMLAGPMIGAAFPAIAGPVVSALMMTVFGLVIILFLVFEPRGLYHRWDIIKSSFRLWPFTY